MSSNGGSVPREQPNTIAEFLVRMGKKLDRLGKDVADIKRRVAAVEKGVVGQSLRLDRLKAALDGVGQKIEEFGEDATPTRH